MENQHVQEQPDLRGESSVGQAPAPEGSVQPLSSFTSTSQLLAILPDHPELEQGVVNLVSSYLLKQSTAVPPPPPTPYPSEASGIVIQQPPGPPPVAAEEAITEAVPATAPPEAARKARSRSPRGERRSSPASDRKNSHSRSSSLSSRSHSRRRTRRNSRADRGEEGETGIAEAEAVPGLLGERKEEKNKREPEVHPRGGAARAAAVSLRFHPAHQKQACKNHHRGSL